MSVDLSLLLKVTAIMYAVQVMAKEKSGNKLAIT